MPIKLICFFFFPQSKSICMYLKEHMILVWVLTFHVGCSYVYRIWHAMLRRWINEDNALREELYYWAELWYKLSIWVQWFVDSLGKLSMPCCIYVRCLGGGRHAWSLSAEQSSNEKGGWGDPKCPFRWIRRCRNG